MAMNEIEKDLRGAHADASIHADLWDKRADDYAAKTTIMRNHPETWPEWEVVAMRAKRDAATKIADGYRAAADYLSSVMACA